MKEGGATARAEGEEEVCCVGEGGLPLERVMQVAVFVGAGPYSEVPPRVDTTGLHSKWGKSMLCVSNRRAGQCKEQNFWKESTLDSDQTSGLSSAAYKLPNLTFLSFQMRKLFPKARVKMKSHEITYAKYLVPDLASGGASIHCSWC